MKTLLILNSRCRNGDGDCIDQVIEALSPLGPVEVHNVCDDSSLEERIDELGSDLGRIVVAGGDGTLNHALPVVLEAGVPLGVLPLGTANDFARSLGLPTDPVDAARLIASDNTRVIDVAQVNDRYFVNAVGIGLGPELTKQMDREKKKRLGVLAYLESLVHVVGNSGKRYADVVVDGRRVRGAFIQITIANGRHYGGGMMVSDDVEMDDGLLHVLCVRPLTPAQMFLRGIRIRFGAVKDDDKLVYLKGVTVEVRTRRRADVTADGELVAATPIVCRNVASSLHVYVPEEQAARSEASVQETAFVATPLRASA